MEQDRNSDWLVKLDVPALTRHRSNGTYKHVQLVAPNRDASATEVFVWPRRTDLWRPVSHQPYTGTLMVLNWCFKVAVSPGRCVRFSFDVAARPWSIACQSVAELWWAVTDTAFTPRDTLPWTDARLGCTGHNNVARIEFQDTRSRCAGLPIMILIVWITCHPHNVKCTQCEYHSISTVVF